EIMNDYMRTLARAALLFTGRPATLSPLLYDSEWDNERSKMSSDPVDFRVILSVDCLIPSEVKLRCDAESVEVAMEHDSRNLDDEDLKWSRNCNYNYQVPETASTSNLGAYWTEDQYLIIQSRGKEAIFKESSGEHYLMPIRLVNVLQPRLDYTFLRESLDVLVKKTREVQYYVKETTEIPQDKDFLCLLKCVPVSEKRDIYKILEDVRKEEEADRQILEKLRAKRAAEGSESLSRGSAVPVVSSAERVPERVLESGTEVGKSDTPADKGPESQISVEEEITDKEEEEGSKEEKEAKQSRKSRRVKK
ncbi:hypothetical protein NPIL_92181, partial [Nephila pilipes]